MATISVIIPIYNVMHYLDRCIMSVVNQTFSDIEIICVDDCSPDRSKDIVSQWKLCDKRISLVSLEKNRGLSGARNAGLDVASGKFVYFLDADDWIETNYLEAMHRMAEKSGCDMIINTNAQGVWEDEVKAVWATALPQGEYWDNISTINKKYYNVWGHLYKHDFLKRNGLRFSEGYIYEDSYFYHMALAQVDRIFAFQGPAYFYRKERAGSIISSINSNYPLLKICKLALQFYRNNPDISCNGIKFYDNRVILKLVSDEELRDFREFYKKNFPFFLQRGFYIDDYEKFLLKCLFASDNLSELQERISLNKNFSFIESATFFWLLLRYSRGSDQQKKSLYMKQIIMEIYKRLSKPIFQI